LVVLPGEIKNVEIRKMTGLASSKREIFLLNLLRIMIGYLFVSRGTSKFFSILSGQGLGMFSLFGFSGILEFFGGTAILLGFFTRPLGLCFGWPNGRN
jgi:uncharacterized membrane protein YphA (DoxX/SURF4 family)